jgi:hypothetical protein
MTNHVGSASRRHRASREGVLASEGLLWVEPLTVSKQALSKRLAVLPTELFRQIFELVTAKIQSQADKLPIPMGWESVNTNFKSQLTVNK